MKSVLESSRLTSGSITPEICSENLRRERSNKIIKIYCPCAASLRLTLRELSTSGHIFGVVTPPSAGGSVYNEKRRLVTSSVEWIA